MGARQPATILLDSELMEPPGNGIIGCSTPASVAAPEPEAEALVATGMNDGEKAAEDPAHEAASVAQGDAPPGVGATTQLLCGAGEGEWLFAVEPSLLAELEATRVAHVHA
eukprot:COSAG01_NODE_5127_length_4469_cov_4.479405_4_plen_111_part_00